MLEFFIFASVTAITPGPNNSMLMASGIKFGRRPSIPHFLGIWLGFTFLFFVGGYILSFVPSEVFTYLQYIGYGVIVYIAYKIATTKTSTDKSKIEKPFTFIQACLFQWVNPKGCNGKSTKCLTHNLWDELENHINNFFEEKSLEDLVKDNAERRS